MSSKKKDGFSGIHYIQIVIVNIMMITIPEELYIPNQKKENYTVRLEHIMPSLMARNIHIL